MHSVQLLSRTRNKGKEEEDAITVVIICIYVGRQPFPGIKDGEVPSKKISAYLLYRLLVEKRVHVDKS